MLLVAAGCGLAALWGWPVAAVAIEESDRLWTVGEHAFQDGLYPLARRTLARFIERYPADRRVPEASLLLGKAYLSEKAYQPALEALRQAQRQSPPPGRAGEARFWEAETLFRMGRYAEARDAYEQVLTDEPASPFAADALYGRAWSNRELKRGDLAVADFQRLLASHPDHSTAASATLQLAQSLVDLKRPQEAVPLLRSFATKYPDHRLLPSARYLLGQALLDAGESREGLAELRAFVAAHPNHELAPEARRLITGSVLRKGSKVDLTDEYKQLMAQSPPTAEALYDAAVIASRLGRAREAEVAWARIRKEFPDHALAARAALDLAQAAFGRSAFKEAAALAQAASKSEDESLRAEGFLLLGESELRLKRHATAYQAFQSALDGTGLDPALRFRALAGSGLALEEQQKWTQAARYYDEVAAKSPDKTLRAWAKERRAAIAAKLKPTPDGKAGPKSSAVKKSLEASRR
ncbi:MAG TPA: tetratricopeptide repeat protein [Methylomirabilota bacterium]|nr:tetratricopeptide repeat protein [Methylomirabilota bacterium]